MVARHFHVTPRCQLVIDVKKTHVLRQFEIDLIPTTHAVSGPKKTCLTIVNATGPRKQNVVGAC